MTSIDKSIKELVDRKVAMEVQAAKTELRISIKNWLEDKLLTNERIKEANKEQPHHINASMFDSPKDGVYRYGTSWGACPRPSLHRKRQGLSWDEAEDRGLCARLDSFISSRARVHERTEAAIVARLKKALS